MFRKLLPLKRMRSVPIWVFAPLLCPLIISLAPSTAQAAVDPVEVYKGKPVDTGDTAWMLTSSALVLMMTGPGPGAVLFRPGPAEERAWHHDAELHPDGRRQRRLGGRRLQPRL